MNQTFKKLTCLIAAASMFGCNSLRNNEKIVKDQKDPKTEVVKQADPQEALKNEELYATYELKNTDKEEDSEAAASQTDSAKDSKLKEIVNYPATVFSNAGKKAYDEIEVRSREVVRMAQGANRNLPGSLHMVPMSVVGGAVAQKVASSYPGYIYPSPVPPPNTESYDELSENGLHQCLKEPLSTFSIDVDTASYSNVRRFITQMSMPPKDAVRIEEMINYFDYEYTQPSKGPFAVNLEVARAPWNKQNKLVRIGIKGKDMKKDKRPASNLVFLIDTSGSMQSPEKMPLVKASMNKLVDGLTENDRISMVVYAGSAGLVLPPTNGSKKDKIRAAINNLEAGGSTNGGAGIELAYKTALEQFIKGGVNRVILATDGDFNVGVIDRDGLLGLVEKNAKKNVYLSILGFGMGNYKDGMMETLSNKGNGNYSYIDTEKEAQKVLGEQLSGTLVTIAKDVKIQVEFNPKFVQAYRLVGYEDRLLKNEDFNNDKKDAGDIGAGHTVTALYEIVPAGVEISGDTSVDALKYQKTSKSDDTDSLYSAKNLKSDDKSKDKVVALNDSDEMLTVKLRYKRPDGDVSDKIEIPLKNQDQEFKEASESFRFASAVAMFGMLLRESDFVEQGDYETVLATAKAAKGSDELGYRSEFIELVNKVNSLRVHQQAGLDD